MQPLNLNMSGQTPSSSFCLCQTLQSWCWSFKYQIKVIALSGKLGEDACCIHTFGTIWNYMIIILLCFLIWIHCFTYTMKCVNNTFIIMWVRVWQFSNKHPQKYIGNNNVSLHQKPIVFRMFFGNLNLVDYSGQCIGKYTIPMGILYAAPLTGNQQKTNLGIDCKVWR